MIKHEDLNDFESKGLYVPKYDITNQPKENKISIDISSENIWKSEVLKERITELNKVIYTYLMRGFEIPEEWVAERDKWIDTLKTMGIIIK